MNHYLLIYDLSDDYLARRAEFRGLHLELAWAAHERGELVLGGALTEPADRAILMFKGETSEVARDFAKSDPYVTSGLIKSWTVRPWLTVVGALAANPVKP
jgi:uncharacterized protein YciI